jgi:DNA-binding NtrC family response regulator
MLVDGDEARTRVLVVDDDAEVRRGIVRRLEGDGHQVEPMHDPREVLELIASGVDRWDVVLLDVGLPEISGIELLRKIRSAGLHASVIMLTGDDSANTATECMRSGAFHYLTKPFRTFELSSLVESGARYALLRRELDQARLATDASSSMLVGTSTAMRNLRSAVARLATQELPILIRGESGTGKELVARALHDTGTRRAQPFVALNCGAIPESLIDSELFGHSKGAFTGATTDRAGVFVEADGGTLFLDEIGDMPLAVQARLLRVLQEGEVRPIGSTGLRKVNVRVIAATHVDLARAVESGRFRLDLYYRLNVVVLAVPPLRDRVDDVPLLAAHFLRKHGGSGAPQLEPETLELMSQYAWPGNVRELENALMYAVALHHGESIGPSALPFQIVPLARGTQKLGLFADDDELPPLTEAKRQLIASFEQSYVSKVLRKSKGSVSEAARLAGLDRANFRRLLQRYSIDPSAFKA